MVAQAYNHNTLKRLRQEDPKFQPSLCSLAASMGNVVSLCLKIKKSEDALGSIPSPLRSLHVTLSVMAYTCNPRTLGG